MIAADCTYMHVKTLRCLCFAQLITTTAAKEHSRLFRRSGPRSIWLPQICHSGKCSLLFHNKAVAVVDLFA